MVSRMHSLWSLNSCMTGCSLCMLSVRVPWKPTPVHRAVYFRHYLAPLLERALLPAPEICYKLYPSKLRTWGLQSLRFRPGTLDLRCVIVGGRERAMFRSCSRACELSCRSALARNAGLRLASECGRASRLLGFGSSAVVAVRISARP